MSETIKRSSIDAAAVIDSTVADLVELVVAEIHDLEGCCSNVSCKKEGHDCAQPRYVDHCQNQTKHKLFSYRFPFPNF